MKDSQLKEKMKKSLMVLVMMILVDAESKWHLLEK